MSATSDLVSTDSIRKELNKILASKGFSSSPILSRFLRFVVEHTLAGRENEIKEYTIGMNVLGKKAGFNPMLDASVRVHAIRLRKLLADYYSEVGLSPLVRIELPKGSYVPAFAGWRADSEVNFPEFSPARTERINNVTRESVCVIPFRGFINHEAPDFSVDSFCQFLSEKLSLFQDISVIHYHDVANLVRKGNGAEDLHKKLGVSHYVTGNIEVEGPEMLVNVQLFDAQRNSIVWAHTSPRRIDNKSIMEMLDGIARHIVSSLAGYSGILHYQRYDAKGIVPALSDKKAMAVYWFYYFQTNQTQTAFQEAIRQLKQVVGSGEDCALHWAVLAHLHIQGIFYGYHTVADPLYTARTMVARALAIDANCQQAYITLAWINVLLRNREGVVQNLDRCDELNPNCTYFKAVCCLGYALAGEYEKCRVFLKQAMELNPLPFAWLGLPGVLMALRHRNYEKMLFHARKIGSTGGVHQYLFELIALYYLDHRIAAAELLDIYLKKYPQGLDQALNVWPAVIFDAELVARITAALQGLKQWAQHTH